jgi:hypothetical protein
MRLAIPCSICDAGETSLSNCCTHTHCRALAAAVMLAVMVVLQEQAAGGIYTT